MAPYNKTNGRINGAITQYINGMTVLQMFLRTDASFKKLRAVAAEMRNYYAAYWLVVATISGALGGWRPGLQQV